jgi:hypothetical protein
VKEKIRSSAACITSARNIQQLAGIGHSQGLRSVPRCRRVPRFPASAYSKAQALSAAVASAGLRMEGPHSGLALPDGMGKE